MARLKLKYCNTMINVDLAALSCSSHCLGKTTFLSVLMDRAGYGTASGSVSLRLEAEDIGAGARSSYTVSELRYNFCFPFMLDILSHSEFFHLLFAS